MEKNKATVMAERLANEAAKLGGTVYYVGGCVRDELLGRPTKDVDVEVHGLSPEVLLGLLNQLGKPLSIGASFGVYMLEGVDMDIALPRREHATGAGHRDFSISVDPFAGEKAACARRDFTVNAMMKHVLTGRLVDPFGGFDDLKAGVLRHVRDDTFSEDALRVLRAAQFAARFSFAVAEETKALCRTMTLTHLSRERVFGELCKALVQAERPSVFFEFLREVGQLSPWFSEVEALIGLSERPPYQAKGDVWTHTMQTLDAAAALSASVVRKRDFMLSALLCNFDKAPTGDIDGVYGYEAAALVTVKAFLRRLTDEEKLLRYCLSMVHLHRQPGMAFLGGASVEETNTMFDASSEGEALIALSLADTGERGDGPLASFLGERLQIYRETMARPYVTGRDLIQAGLAPNESFSTLLAYARKLRLAGLDKESQLAHILSYYRKDKRS